MVLMSEAKQMLQGRFHIKDLGRLSCFLGINFEQVDSFVMINQRRYLTKILDRFEMSNCKLAFGSETPCDRRYCEVVGSLVYAMACTRPDKCWVIEKLESFCYFDHHTHFITCTVIILAFFLC